MISGLYLQNQYFSEGNLKHSLWKSNVGNIYLRSAWDKFIVCLFLKIIVLCGFIPFESIFLIRKPTGLWRTVVISIYPQCDPHMILHVVPRVIPKSFLCHPRYHPWCCPQCHSQCHPPCHSLHPNVVPIISMLSPSSPCCPHHPHLTRLHETSWQLTRKNFYLKSKAIYNSSAKDNKVWCPGLLLSPLIFDRFTPFWRNVLKVI